MAEVSVAEVSVAEVSVAAPGALASQRRYVIVLTPTAMPERQAFPRRSKVTVPARSDDLLKTV